jgi:hypothetical protein
MEASELPEVIRLHDARGERPPNAVGVGGFWYEPDVWSLSLSPTARVLYAGLCSFLGHGEINRKDLRNTLRSRSEAEILEAFEELVRRSLLTQEPSPKDALAVYEVRSVKKFEG